ncbi:MAG: ABC transporter ATP-binding protein [Acidobacteriota bacterium]
MAAVEIDGLTKDYLVGFWRRRPYRALDGLTLTVEAGEIFGFLGPNGAGKSTTLKLLMQLIYPTAGRAAILGRPIGDRAMRRRIGFLPENPYFYDYLTAEELLTYFGSLFGLRGMDLRRRVSAVLDEVGIGRERTMRLRAFSKGMIQRVGIAQAILNEPEVVFFDEPMSGLDPLGRRDVRQAMLRLRDRGCTVFFSSHILSDAEALCSRVAILAKGRLVAAGRLSEMVPYGATGWEMVVAGVDDVAIRALAGAARKVTPLPDRRAAVELAPDVRPERFLASLPPGVEVVALNPMRATLEDYFVRTVAAPGERAGG